MVAAPGRLDDFLNRGVPWRNIVEYAWSRVPSSLDEGIRSKAHCKRIETTESNSSVLISYRGCMRCTLQSLVITRKQCHILPFLYGSLVAHELTRGSGFSSPEKKNTLTILIDWQHSRITIGEVISMEEVKLLGDSISRARIGKWTEQTPPKLSNGPFL